MSRLKPAKFSGPSSKKHHKEGSTTSHGVTRTHGIWNDQQIPFEDPRAFSVAVQIFADAKLHTLIDNGDWGDYQSLGTHAKGDRDDLYLPLQLEIKRQRERYAESHKAIKPKVRKFTDGNHEWRIARAFQKDPRLAAKVLEIKFDDLRITSIRDALSTPGILEFHKFGTIWAGPYPKGIWLLEGGADNPKNVYVHHGYTARKKSGYTVTGQMDDHWCSQVVGHCERLAGPIWTRRMGRDFFGIENGNVSMIGEPNLGDGIYAGIPFSDPKLMNHRQGITIIYEDGGELWPFSIRIVNGKAHFNGKLYKA
jgi:hypothetical protein